MNQSPSDAAASDPGSPRALSVRANLLWNTAGTMFYQGCLWLTTVLVVTLSRDYANSGALAYGMALGNILFTIATYNMRSVQVSDARGRHTTGEYIGFRIVTMAVSVIVMGCYALATTHEPSLLIAAFCFFLFRLDEAFSSVYFAIEQKAERMDYIGKSQVLRGLLVLALFSAGLVLTGKTGPAVIAMSLGCIAVTFLFDMRRARRFDEVWPVFKARVFIDMARRYLPAFISLLCYGSVVSLARQIFGNIYGADELGIYAAVATPTVIVQLAASFLTAPFVVGLSRAAAAHDRHALVRGLMSIVGGLAVVFAVLIALAALFGEGALTRLYGPSIAEATHLLVPVIIATSEVAFAAVFLDVLVSIGELNGLMVANLAALALTAGIARPLMEAFQMAGINWTIMVSFGAALVIDAAVFTRALRRL